MVAPIRTCAGCGRKAPKAELLRFAADCGELRGRPGISGARCLHLPAALLLRARASLRGFNRSSRTQVRVDTALRDLYTDADG